MNIRVLHFTVIGTIAIVSLQFIKLFFNKISNESTLKARAAQLDKERFEAAYELQKLKRELNEGKLSTNLISAPPETVIKEVVKEVIPQSMKVEIENLKREKEHIWNEKEQYR